MKDWNAKWSWVPPRLGRNGAAHLANAKNTETLPPLLEFLCQSLQIRRAIDIGVWRGASTWALGRLLVKPAVQISIESKARFLKAITPAMRTISDLAWHPVAGRADEQDYRELCKRAGIKSVGLIFHDGAHDYETVSADIEKLLPVLGQAGVFVFHDFDNPEINGVRRAVRERFGEGWQTWYAGSRVGGRAGLFMAQRFRKVFAVRGKGDGV